MRLLLTLFAASAAFLASPQPTTLLLKYKSGATQEFPIDEDSKITVSPNHIIITSEGKRTPLPMSQLKGYEFITDNSGIGLITENGHMPLMVNGNSIEVPPSDSQRTISLIDLEGRVLNTSVVRPREKATVSTEQLSPGIYIICIDGSNFKFAKK